MLLTYAAPSIITIIEMGAGAQARWSGKRMFIQSLREESVMRMLLRVSVPVEAGNAAAKAGTLGPTIERILADLKPEAAYFFADDDGNRSGSIVFDMKDSSQIPAIAEPWFLAFNAKVSFRPVMNPQDLATAGPSITKAGQQFGK
jgi:hypothetical protein